MESWDNVSQMGDHVLLVNKVTAFTYLSSKISDKKERPEEKNPVTFLHDGVNGFQDCVNYKYC
jgi:hypothetical protein